MKTLAMVLLVGSLATFAMTGCGGSSSGPGTAPTGGELEQYLKDNPDVANAEDMETEEEDE